MKAIRFPRFRTLVAWCAAASVLFVVWVTFDLGGGRVSVWFDDIATAAAACFAAGACLWASRRRPETRFWLLLGLTGVAWAAGEVLWALAELTGRGDVPFPSWPDVGYLAALPLAVAALMVFPIGLARAWGRARAVLDGLLIASALFFVSWSLLLDPLAHSQGGLSRVVSLAYPLADVVIISVAVILAYRCYGHGRQALWLVLAGLVAISASDSIYAYLTEVRQYASGHFIDVGWFAGYLLLALAAFSPGEIVGGRRRPVRLLSETTPYLVFLPAVVVAGYRIATGRLDTVSWWVGLASVVLLTVRQLVSLADNVTLNRELEAKVASRTAALSRQEARFRSLLQNSSDLVLVLDADGVVTDTSLSVAHALGVDTAAIVGMDVLAIAVPADRARLAATLDQVRARPHASVTAEFRLAAVNDESRWLEAVLANQLEDPAVNGLVLNARDVSERRLLEDELRHQALHDPLTGLPNRVLFHDRLVHAITRLGRRPGRPAVLFVDLDDFKIINDTEGHDRGDLVLATVAERLVSCVRSGDTVARFGGDEFAVLLDDFDSEHEPETVATRIRDALSQPVDLADHHVFVRASIGLAGWDDSTAEELLRQADVAMYQAKTQTKGTWCRYDPVAHGAIFGQFALEADLHGATERGELSVHYQPIVDLETHATIGVEALVRWNHPTRGLVGPVDFIPVAERSGLIFDIGRWVLTTACHDGARWQHQQPDFELSVNLSARQLAHPDIADVVATALAETGFPAANLVLEITESALMDDDGRSHTHLAELSALGIRLAIDDFGTGYSSLAYLSRLPVQILKIDQSFVSALGDDARPSALVDTIVRLAHQLNLTTVAEGIETEATAGAVTSLGCNYGQGYLYARPGPATHIDQLLATTPVLSG